jgi:hypothetical protein
MTTATITTPEPHVAETYEPGAILEYQWGYEQTNVDYFMVTKRVDKPDGTTWLTVVEMTTAKKVETGFMSGRCEPGVPIEGAKPIRRKLHKWEGSERGLSIRSYGWCSLWDGRPSNWSSYG